LAFLRSLLVWAAWPGFVLALEKAHRLNTCAWQGMAQGMALGMALPHGADTISLGAQSLAGSTPQHAVGLEGFLAEDRTDLQCTHANAFLNR
jgi:hypothetical protein